MTQRDDGACLRPHERLVLGGILLLALLLHIVPLTYSHFWDETVYLQHARVIVDGRANYDEFDYRPPLLPILYAAGYLIWDNIFVANIVQGVVSTLAVLFAFLFTRQAFGSLAALTSAALFAFTPYFVVNSQALMPDMPAVALMLGAMWLYGREGAGSALVAGIAAALAGLTHFTALFVFVYIVLYALFAAFDPRRLAWFGAGATIAMAPYLLWVRWNYGSFFHTFALASRITTEWEALVPANFYLAAIPKIFPPSILGLFVIGLVASAREWPRGELSTRASGLLSQPAKLDIRTGRTVTVLVWGLAFFLYMLRIPHKEVRYLLPLAIPIVVVSSVGVTALWRWLVLRAWPVRAVGLLIALAVVVIDYGPAFARITWPWVDLRESESVQIALYVRGISTPDEVVYAAHEFPILAFYSERKTISLLPAQADFEQAWRNWMRFPGYFVFYPPEAIEETHSKSAVFKPEASFIAAHRNFRLVRQFPNAAVYRYDP